MKKSVLLFIVLLNIMILVNANIPYEFEIDSINNARELSTTYDWVDYGSSSESFGMGVSSAGDINGDEYSDVLIVSMNGVYIYYGSSAGLPATHDKFIGFDPNHKPGYASYAGDVNADGYSDIVIGLSQYDGAETDMGAVMVYYGSPSGLGLGPDWVAYGDSAGGNFGRAVSTAGDVNGDGYSDIIIGDFGNAYIYHGSETGLSDSSDWKKAGPQSGNWSFSCCVGTAGDVNGDGYSDVIIGADKYTNGQLNEGMAYVYNGSASGVSTSHSWSGEANAEYSDYGSSVSTAGDMNGDGYSDVIIGSPMYDDDGDMKGAVFIYYGSSSGLSSTPDLSRVGGYGPTNNDRAGSWVTCIGDNNGDGLCEIAYGCPGDSLNLSWQGSVITLPYYQIFFSDQSHPSFGRVAGAGDVNGDGFSDLIVGAPSYSSGGAAFVYYGRPENNGSSPDDLIIDHQSSEGFGTKVVCLGDIDGDRYEDVVIAAQYYDNAYTSAGRICFYKGTSEGIEDSASLIIEGNAYNRQLGWGLAKAGDINGDGYYDMLIGALANDGSDYYSLTYIYYGSSSGFSSSYDSIIGNQAGATTMSLGTAGDINGDGYSDFIIGSASYDNGETDEGVVFIYYGNETGYSTTYDMLEINIADAYFGRSVSTAGDVNGDGFSDIIIGAPNKNSNRGSAYVFHGTSSGISSTYSWTYNGSAVDDRLGSSVSTAGDVNGDGYSDVIIGIPYWDGGYNNAGAVYVFYGSSSGITSSGYSYYFGNNDLGYAGLYVGTWDDFNGDGFSDIMYSANEYMYCNQGSDSGLINSAYGIGSSRVGSAGDINGDGFSDVITGNSSYNSEGRARISYGGGNEGGRLAVLTQLTCDESRPIAVPLYSGYEGRFRIRMNAWHIQGIGKVKLQWEVKPLGTPFDGTGLSESTYWTYADTSGVDIVEEINGLLNDTYYKWRVRIKYDMTTGMPQPYSRWYYISDNAPTEVDLKTGSTVMINEININSMIVDDGIYLSVLGSGDRYVINKKESGKFISLGDMKNNEYTDKNPIEGMNEYRIDESSNGKINKRAEIAVFFASQRNINMEGFYTNIEKLNREIKEQGLFIYDINGRKIKSIDNPGAYYIIREIDNQITNTEKVIIIQ